MLYANFGHNAMNYTTNTRLSSTFASATQNQFLLDGLKWLGGADTTTPPEDSISETSWYSLTNAGNGTCVDARSAATANGTAIQQYACNGTQAQQFQFRSTDSGYRQIGIRANPQQVIDVTGVSTADNAPLQLWAYGGGQNQQWLPVKESTGRYHFAARHSGKCLTAASRRDEQRAAHPARLRRLHRAELHAHRTALTDQHARCPRRVPAAGAPS